MKLSRYLKKTVALSGIIMPAFMASFLTTPLQAASLEEALQTAFYSNPTLMAQRTQVLVTQEQVEQALSGWRPVVEASGSVGYLDEKNDTATTSTDDQRGFFTAALTATQNLYAGGETEAREGVAENAVLAEQARLKTTEQAVLLNAATAYLDVLRDISVLELNIQNEKRLLKQLEATEDRFAVGEVTRTDVAQAESRLSGARAETIAATGTLEISKAAYIEVVGEDIGTTIVTPVLNLGLPVSKEEAITLAIGNNPAIVARNFAYQSALKDIEAQKAGLKPNVDLVASANYQDESSTENFSSRDASLRLQFSVPLYQAGQVRSQIRAAREAANRAESQIRQEERTVTEQATVAWENLVTSRAQIAAREEEVRASEIAFEGVEQEAAVGSRTVLDVLDAEQDLLDARVKLVQSQRDENVAQFNLLSSIGRLTLNDLGLDNVAAEQ